MHPVADEFIVLKEHLDMKNPDAITHHRFPNRASRYCELGADGSAPRGGPMSNIRSILVDIEQNRSTQTPEAQ